MKMSLKKRYNEISREIAYAGPILCRALRPFTVSRHPGIFVVEAGDYVLLFRGPLPSGGHRTIPGGSLWLVYTENGLASCAYPFDLFDGFIRRD